MYLDKRIHRIVKLSTLSTNEIDLASTSATYKVIVTSNTAGTVNTLIITKKPSGTLVDKIDCVNIFTPMHCGTPIAMAYNPDAQRDTPGLDPALHRIWEVHEVLNVQVAGGPKLVVRSSLATSDPDDAKSNLHYTPAGMTASAVNDIVIPLDDKIPPKLG